MFTLPEYVKEILNTLHNAGFEAYVVGGAVRDMLMGKAPSDFDITTSCPPETTAALFKKTVPTGIKHGTVTVIIDNKNIEVTTFRQDNSYTDHRKPDSVNFVTNLEEDLKRRDFTVNSIAYSDKTGIIDLFGGKSDIKNKIIRAVGDPGERFFEDALRIVRAFRFASKLNFSIEAETLTAALDNAHLLKGISRERLFSELRQILLSNHPENAEQLILSGAFSNIGINKIKNLSELSKLPRSLYIRFYYFCKNANADAVSIGKALRTDNKLLNYCRTIQKLETANISTEGTDIKRALNLSDKKILKDYYTLRLNAKNTDKIFAKIDKIMKSGEPYKISQLNINGNDIIHLGCNSKNIGSVLEFLLEKVIADPSVNNKSQLTLLAINFIKTQCTL